MRILVTGGAGYIGSVAAHILLEKGYEVTVLDDLSTGRRKLVPSAARFVEGSILDKNAIQLALGECEAVIHFAAKSLVGESVLKPEKYWSTNVTGTATLLAAMRGMGVKKLVFSSTAATYGEPKSTPITEAAETKPTNPYGSSKLATDNMITSESIAYGLAAISLRYFNVAGAYRSKSGWLTEEHDPETHLIPNLLRAKSDAPMKIFGTDWPTKDGTCIRDYVHVVDLIDAHISALEKLELGFNAIGVLSGRTILKPWRFAIFGIMLFAAVFTPTGDPFTMLILAVPLIFLYFLSGAISLLRDKRKKTNKI